MNGLRAFWDHLMMWRRLKRTSPVIGTRSTSSMRLHPSWSTDTPGASVTNLRRHLRPVPDPVDEISRVQYVELVGCARSINDGSRHRFCADCSTVLAALVLDENGDEVA